MVRGHMCCGVTGEDLMVRVRPDAFDDAVLLPHARPMDFTGRPMKGFVFVDSAGLESDEQLTEWVDRGLEFVSTSHPSNRTLVFPDTRLTRRETRSSTTLVDLLNGVKRFA